MSGRPEPVTEQRCSLCREPWDEHERSAKQRWRERHADREPVPGAALPLAVVSPIDCVAVLQSVRRGPAGPQGPMGATGLQGLPGRDAGGKT